MNYYEHHIGDYAEATAHLNFTEDAAYSRLIRKYYASEKPLPAELKTVQRLVGARTKEEREAVSTVLDEFFTLQDDGWHNQRCDEEVARYLDKQDKAKRSANARWNKPKTHSDGNANASVDNLGEYSENAGSEKNKISSDEIAVLSNGRKNTPILLNSNESHHANASPNAMRTHSDGNAHQAPDTRHHTKTIEQRIPVESSGQPEIEKTRAAAVDENSSGSLATVLRKHGVTITPQHPVLLAWVKDGFTLQQMLEAVEVARMRKPDPEPIPPNYLDPILREPKTKKTSEPAWWATEQTMLAKGREVGCQPNTGEGWPEYRARLNRIVQSKTARGGE